MINKFEIMILLAIVLAFTSCSTTNDVLPEGNVEKLNTAGNDDAPVQKPGADECEPCSKEFSQLQNDENHGIKPSSYFLKEIIGEKLLTDAEAITFITDSSGFFSVSHPPDEASAQALDIPLSGSTGGTDIFEFSKVNGRYVFNNSGTAINTKTWDSHPAAVSDDGCNILLVWSSDRSDSSGFSSPFSTIEKLDAGSAYRGNSDLFYAFRINGIWSGVKNLNVAGDSINTDKNEETPFLTCMCLQPYLLFASNRDGDYDIYWAKLSVDFRNQTIKMLKAPRIMPQDSKSGINTPYKEFFPFVPSPLSTNPGENFIYFSSNRYQDPVPVDAEGKTRLKNVGNFDIYRFTLPDEISCIPPKITYRVNVLDITNPANPVRQPVLSLTPASGQTRTMRDNPVEFNLKPGVSYSAAGGSLHDEIICEKGVDRTISNYAFREITRLEPEIIKRDTTIEYMELVQRNTRITYDTVRQSFTIASNEIGNLNLGSARKLESIIVRGDSLDVSLTQLVEKSQGLKFDTVRKTRKVPLEFVVERYDTSFIRIANGMFALSEITQREGKITAPDVKEDVLIEDTVWVWPQYYYFPPCEWKYVLHNVEYRRNVPYFQTGFWEVNTVQNLPGHINRLRSKELSDASFIELHPKNNYFGYNRENLTEAQKAQRRVKYEHRVSEYRHFAKQVDENLDDMTDEIAGSILPLFNKLDTKGSGAQNKLIVMIQGFSDIRPIQRGVYNGDEPVTFLSASYDTTANRFLSEVSVAIQPGASLVGEDNDILSKLRTYYGYREVLKKLKKFQPFNDYLNRGEVLLPDQVRDKAEFDKKFATSKIVFVLEGKQVDPTTYKIPGYVGEEGDFHSLDPIRRINVIVKRVEVVGGVIKNPDCCNQVSANPDS